MNKYRIYKGLQNPLTFKGFKGRYIYWGIGFIGAGVILGLILLITVGTVVGMSTIIVIMGGGLFYTYKKQTKGLYPIRNDNNRIFLMRKKEVFKNGKKNK